MPASKPRMRRWYNPELGDYEWREVPPSDEESLELLDHFPGYEHYARIYGERRDAGASIVAVLIRAGESVELGPPPKRP